MKRKIVKIIISAILFAIAKILKTDYEWIRIILFILSYLTVGFDVIKEAIEKIFKKEFFDENFLMSLATIGAIAIKQYPEAVAVMLFYQVGEIFEDLAVDKSKKSISSLLKIRPDYAWIKDENGELIKKKPEEIKIDDEIIVKPGEKIPLDGIVIDGKSTIDTATLTGESIPQEVATNNLIYSGCVNLSSVLTIKVTKIYEESTVNKIINLVQNATEKKTETENFITKFSKIYTPIVVILALIIAIVPALIFKVGNFQEWIYKALTFLVISCPCALVISVPLSFFGGIGGASRKGILVKGSNYLETLAKLNTVVFDKTGTLTKGIFEVQEIIPEDITRDELLEIAVYAENYSDHPIAKSLKKLYKNKIQENRISNVKELAGKGISCEIENFQNLNISSTRENKSNENENCNNQKLKVVIGNITLMNENGIDNIKMENNQIGTTLFVSINEKYCGKIVISDEIKDDAKKTISDLKEMGISKTIMLTGDKKKVGEFVAKELRVDEVYSQLLPQEKLEKMEEFLTLNFKSGNGSLAFVGDGINDAPSLARADIGIAMGGLGSDAAIESADVVIMDDKPSKIAKAIKIAKKTIKIAKENIWFAIAIKIIILILSVFNITTMWEAVFADVGVTIIAVLNSFRALR